MRVTVILTVAGCDRPGLTRALADAVADAGGNWLESHLVQLRGMYVGSVLVELAEDHMQLLEDAVCAVDSTGLRVSLVRTGSEPVQQGHALTLELVAQDRPGIVREVTTALAALSVNIDRFESSVENSSWSGARLFRATAQLELPTGVREEQVREALERLSGEIMVDLENESGEAHEPGHLSGLALV